MLGKCVKDVSESTHTKRLQQHLAQTQPSKVPPVGASDLQTLREHGDPCALGGGETRTQKG